MNYTVEIKEVLRRKVNIEAYSEDEAQGKVKSKYFDGEIILDSADISVGETDFCVLGVE